jgi:L-lactate dehydrogenase complex protein LldG
MKHVEDSLRAEMLAKIRRVSAAASPRLHRDSHDEAVSSKPPNGVPEQSLKQLTREFERLSGEVRLVQGMPSACAAIATLAQESNYRRIAVGSDPLLKSCGLATTLHNSGRFESIVSEEYPVPSPLIIGALAKCHLGITGCAAIIADTATIVLNHDGFGGRSISLLPECHLVVAERSQIFETLDDWMDFCRFTNDALPSCLTLVTGPSRTADIEKVLVTGVHGPLRLVLVLVV